MGKVTHKVSCEKNSIGKEKRGSFGAGRKDSDWFAKQGQGFVTAAIQGIRVRAPWFVTKGGKQEQSSTRKREAGEEDHNFCSRHHLKKRSGLNAPPPQFRKYGKKRGEPRRTFPLKNGTAKPRTDCYGKCRNDG